MINQKKMEKNLKMKNQRLKQKKNLYYQLVKMDMVKKLLTWITELLIEVEKV